jgi:hypothetical protein
MHYLVGKKQQSWRVSWVLKGHKWACWKGRKPTAWHLIPLDKHLGKQGCNFWFRDHEMFNPRISRLVNICPSVLFMFSCISSAWLFVASLLFYLFVVIHHLVSCLYSHSFVPLDHFKFASVSVLICSVSSDYSLFDYSVLFSVLILEMYSRYLIPTTTIWQVNKHRTTRLHQLLS